MGAPFSVCNNEDDHPSTNEDLIRARNLVSFDSEKEISTDFVVNIATNFSLSSEPLGSGYQVTSTTRQMETVRVTGILTSYHFTSTSTFVRNN